MPAAKPGCSRGCDADDPSSCPVGNRCESTLIGPFFALAMASQPATRKLCNSGEPPHREHDQRIDEDRGDISRGFARVRCPACRFKRLLLFSRENSGFRPSRTASHLSDAVWLVPSYLTDPHVLIPCRSASLLETCPSGARWSSEMMLRFVVHSLHKTSNCQYVKKICELNYSQSAGMGGWSSI